MKIVIDIDEEVKNRLRFGITYSKDIQVVCEALNDGIPLPKGHGRLIDADVVLKKMEERIEKLGDDKSIYEWSCVDTALEMYAPTIIEADKESEE